MISLDELDRKSRVPIAPLSNSVGEIVGDPTEAALVVLAAKGGIDATTTRQRYPRIAEIPFDSAYKFMATFHNVTDRAGNSQPLRTAADLARQECVAVVQRDGRCQ